MTTDAERDAYLQNVPAKFATLAARALQGGKLSPREHIKAKCLECSNWQVGEVAGCRVWRCPLHSIRPYRDRP